MGFKQRWNLWRRRCLKQPVDEIHQAGDNSELRLEKLTRAAGRKNNWSVHGSVRIPDPDGGRREIDLILISGSVVLVVEQKHWSGRFEVKEDGEFIQHRNNGTMHSHATVSHRIARKTRLLTEIHAQRYPDDKLDIQTFVAVLGTGTVAAREALLVADRALPVRRRSVRFGLKFVLQA